MNPDVRKATQEESEAFRFAVAAFCDGPDGVAAISREFQVSKPSVRRWANGVSAPFFWMQKRVLSFISTAMPK